MRFNSVHILLLFCALALAATGEQNQTGGVEQELERRLKVLSERAQGTVGLSVVHIETGKMISINGKSQLPLYSVFKLPLAIAVLKDVEENRLRLDQKVHVTPEEIVPGAPETTALWKNPIEATMSKPMEYSNQR